MDLKYRHKSNGRMMTASTPWLWSLAFGGFYFLYRKAWLHSGVWLLALLPVLGLAAESDTIRAASAAWTIVFVIVHFAYPFFASKALTSTYKTRGWERVS